MAISVINFLTGSEDICSHDSAPNCFVFVIFNLGKLLFACLPIIFIGEAAWSAFKKRRHWIPAGSLVMSALVLQFLPLLDRSFNFPNDVISEGQQTQVKSQVDKLFPDTRDYLIDNNFDELDNAYYSLLILYSNWVSVLCGRVSMFVLMGCLLPGVARPLSNSLWRDMAALVISSSLSLFHISYETFQISKMVSRYYYTLWMFLVWNLFTLVSLAILVLLLFSAALGSVCIRKTWSHKIPTLTFAQNFSRQSIWEKVEEREGWSLIVARTADPQYIMARSILSSAIAFVITICNGILISEIIRFILLGLTGTFLDIWFVLRCMVIVMGSIIIYWRCITSVVFYAQRLGWKLPSLAHFFQIEDFWKSHLLDFIKSFNTPAESGGDIGLQKLMMRLFRLMKFHKFLYVLYYLQMFSILLSKTCWLLAHLFFSNKYLARLLLGSAYEEFSNLSKIKSDRIIILGKGSEFDKHLKSLGVMEGENPAGIWMANRTSIQEIKEQMKKGEEEGKSCNDLISLLKDYSTPEFSGEICTRLQVVSHIRLKVEKELDVKWELTVHKCSWRITAVSIIAVIIKLSQFTQDQAGADINMVHSVIEACSQAWNMIDLIEISTGEVGELSNQVNNLFQILKEKHELLDYNLPVSSPVERTTAAAEEAMKDLFEKAKQVANQDHSRKWIEIIAAYNLYMLGVYINYQSTNVEIILNKLSGMLADVIGSCIVKAAGVIMEDCKKHASLYDEESILRIAGIAGKVKGVTEQLGWKLKWNQDEETQSIKTSLARAIEKYPTFQLA